MATLTNSDFRDIKKRTQRDLSAKAAFGGWALNKAQWMAAFQAAEDWFVSGFLSTPTESFKAAIEVVTGATTNERTKQLGFVWMGWRFAVNP